MLSDLAYWSIGAAYTVLALPVVILLAALVAQALGWGDLGGFILGYAGGAIAAPAFGFAMANVHDARAMAR